MSWWNTSNLTDFASKALKNAQKKIDKALDIPVDEKGSKSTTDEAKADPNAKSKADFWSAWSTPDDGAGSSDSSWSFPWGGGPEPEKEAEPEFKEKTAEEIKSEVLKAAKERTKAKSKLFPKSSKKETSAGVGSAELKDKAKSEDLSEKQQDQKQGHDLIQTFQFPDKKESSDSEATKVVAEESVIATRESVEDSPPPVDFSNEKVSDVSQVALEEKTQDEVSISKVSEHTLESSPVSVTHSVEGIQQDEINSDEERPGERALHKTDSYEKLNLSYSTEDSAVPDVKQEVSEVKETHSSSEVLENVLHETVDPTEDLTVESPRSDESNFSCPEAVDYNAFATDSVADISSSVEFVTDKDISNDSGSVSGDTFTNVGKEDICSEQAGSDPEMIDCDKCDKADGDDDDDDNGAQNVKESGNEASRVSDFVSKETDMFTPTEDKPVYQAFVECMEGNEPLEAKMEADQDISADVQLETTSVCDTSVTVPSSESESSMAKLDTSLETSASEDTLVEAQSPYCAKVEDSADDVITEKQLMFDIETKSENEEEINSGAEGYEPDVHEGSDDNDKEGNADSDGNRGDVSPANSFVKCMLEDAIEEGKLDDNCDSLSGNSKSDGSRSIYSNHESGDEIDTTTSSDIEIISLPTPNGDYKLVSQLDPVPLRIALQKTSWRGSPTHKRTDSSDSSSASKDGCELSPGRDSTLEYQDYPRSHHEHSEGLRISELPALSEEDDNPYHPQRLLNADNKTDEVHDLDTKSHDQLSHDPQFDTQQADNKTDEVCDLDTESHDKLSPDSEVDTQQKLAEMSEVLQAREVKLLQLSKDNCDLMETNSILNSQLKQVEEAREAEMTDINELTTEFTSRLTESEKRVSTAIREKESLKKQLQEAQAELTRREGDVSLKQLMVEKDEQIAGLLQEGEKLSKSQLQSNTIIKKLRQKEKDIESTITTQKKQLDKQKEDLDHLNKVLESKEDLEKKQTEAVAQLTAAVNKQEQEMVRLRSEHEDAVEKARGLQVALDNSYKEMAELHRNTAVMDSKAQEAALSAEMQVREELKMTIEKQTQQHRWEKDSLSMQLDDLRLSMARMEKDHNRREDLLKQEIGDLHKQLQEDEARTQELTQGVSLATRPLLRQIENLQSTFNAQSATWERIEKSLTDRLGETQTNLAVALENERTASEKVMDLESRVTSLETQNSRLRQEKSILTAQLDALKAKVEIAEDAKQSEAAQLEVIKQQMSKEITELKKQTVLSDTQLDLEKSKLEQEKKKVAMLQEQIRDLERDAQRSRSRGTSTPVRQTPSPISVSRQDSMVSSLQEHSFSAITQDELDRSFILSTPNGNKQSLYEALRQSGASNLLENLQSQLKMREGEISHLQSEIRSLERTRESMARELVDLSNQKETLEEKVKDMPQLQQQYTELDQRYNALLQMYGEKVEEAEELKMDLHDVKDMYKAQINQLLSQQLS